MRYVFTILFLWPTTLFAQDPSDDAGVPTKTGKVNLTLDPGRHTAPIRRCFLSADAKQITTVSADSSIRIWDLESGETIRTLYPPGQPDARSAKASADGKRLAISSLYRDKDQDHQVIYVIALPEGRLERVLKDIPGGVAGFDLSADGRLLAAVNTFPLKQGVRVWDLTREAAPFVILKGKPVNSVAISPDGQRIAWNNKIQGEILELNSGRQLGKISGGSLSWSPDGKLLTTTLPGQLRIHNDKGEIVRTIEEPSSGVLHRKFSPDSKSLLVNWDPANNHCVAALYDVDSGQLLHRFYPKGVFMAYGGDISKDGKLAVTVGGMDSNYIFLWRTETGEIVRSLRSPIWIGGGAAWIVPAWTKDGKVGTWYAAFTSKFKESKLRLGAFDFANLKLVDTPSVEARHVNRVEDAGLMLKYAAYNRTQVIEDGKVIQVLQGGNFDAAFVGQGRVAVTKPGAQIKIFEARTGKEINHLVGRPGIHGGSPIASPDPRYILTVAIGSQTVSVWNVEGKAPLLTLFRRGDDWVLWTEEGYYAATPGGERLVGWTVDNGIDQMATFFPAEQFSKTLHRPDVIKLVLEKGSVAEALKAANAALGKVGEAAVKSVSTPEQLLPAIVKIAVDQSRLPEVVVKVNAKAAVKEQPIHAVRLMVDGRRLPDGVAAIEFSEGKEQAEFSTEWRVTLPPGRHQIAALALSKDYTPGVSNKVDVSSPAKVQDRPALHQLTVGVSDYQTVRPNLQYAHKDATQISEALTEAAKAGLAYRPGHSAQLLDKDATSANLLAELQNVRKLAQPNDLFVFSFAGHGVRDAGEFFLLMHESDQTDSASLKKTAVSGKVLRELLGSFPCQVLLMLDACHAGAVGGLASGSDEAARSLSDVEVRVAVLGAANGHERAKEKDGNGLFTAAVIRALRKDPEAFYNRSTGEMNVAHLWTFVYQEVTKEANGSQTPYLRLPIGHPAFTVTQFPLK